MNCLTRTKMEAFWREHEHLARPSVAVTDSVKQPVFRRRINANIENWSAGQVPSLARALAHWLWWDDHLLLEHTVVVDIFERSVWSSSEDWNLYDAWRLARSGSRALQDDAPGHLFLQYEQADCASLLFLGLTAGWGLSCASPYCSRAFHVNHDGHGLAVAHSEADLDSASRIYGRNSSPRGVSTRSA